MPKDTREAIKARIRIGANRRIAEHLTDEQRHRLAVLGVPVFDVQVFLGDREITDLLDVRVHRESRSR